MQSSSVPSAIAFVLRPGYWLLRFRPGRDIPDTSHRTRHARPGLSPPARCARSQNTSGWRGTTCRSSPAYRPGPPVCTPACLRHPLHVQVLDADRIVFLCYRMGPFVQEILSLVCDLLMDLRHLHLLLQIVGGSFLQASALPGGNTSGSRSASPRMSRTGPAWRSPAPIPCLSPAL